MKLQKEESRSNLHLNTFHNDLYLISSYRFSFDVDLEKKKEKKRRKTKRKNTTKKLMRGIQKMTRRKSEKKENTIKSGYTCELLRVSVKFRNSEGKKCMLLRSCQLC